MWDFTGWPAGEAALGKHLLCDARPEIDAATLALWASLYNVDDAAAERVASEVALDRHEDAWDAPAKNAAVMEAIAQKAPRFAVLNGREDLSHTQIRLSEEASAHGVPLDIFNLHDFALRGDKLTGPATLAELGQYTTIFVTAPEPLAADAAPVDRFIYQLWALIETAGAPIVPSRRADWLARDKMLSSAALFAAGVPSPDTLATTSIAQALAFVHECRERERPTVLKPIGKGGGWGVMWIPVDWPDTQVLDVLGKYKWWYGAGVLYIQEFVPNEGHDKRVLLLGDVVLGVEDRTAAPEGESWIYNISKGGEGHAGSVTPAQLSTAQQAAKACEQWFTGVDLLPGADGVPYVLEINSNPGFAGFEKYVGANVGTALLRYCSLFGAPR